MLILFDIDGTLLTSRAEVNDGGSRDGVGTASWIEAGRNLYGPAFTLDGVEIAGRLDVLIWRDAAARNGAPVHDQEHQRFRAEYGRMLRKRLDNGAEVRLLPGVRELVEQLAQRDELTLGLLTGNYPETGRMKIEAAGLDSGVFTVAAWGDEGLSRRDLPPVAMRAHRERSGCAIEPQQVIIIGDTPHDVDCALHNDCRALAVCTGTYDAEQLSCCGAHCVVADLSETEAVLEWLLQSHAAAAE